MIDTLRALAALLSKDTVSIEDVIARVGPVISDPGGLVPIDLRPTIPAVKSAYLARHPETGLPYLLSLELTTDGAPTVAELSTAFGDYRRLRTDRGQPPEIAFAPGAPNDGSHFFAVLTATLESAAEPLGDRVVTGVALRRDGGGD
jgi:hypothetical protein